MKKSSEVLEYQFSVLGPSLDNSSPQISKIVFWDFRTFLFFSILQLKPWLISTLLLFDFDNLENFLDKLSDNFLLFTGLTVFFITNGHSIFFNLSSLLPLWNFLLGKLLKISAPLIYTVIFFNAFFKSIYDFLHILTFSVWFNATI